MPIATGHFRVGMVHQEENRGDGNQLERMTLNKTFMGDLSGSGAGAMLTAITSVPGSADYVVIERISGVLHEKPGTFVLTHHGRMERKQGKTADISVVPDSGTGELEGIRGTMTIEQEGGKHTYTFEYEL